MTQPLTQLAYVSKAREFVDEETLNDILNKSVKNNTQFNITGFLMYGERTFVQVIEGPKENIDALYGFLLKDGRHFDIVRLLYRDTEERLFDTWRMAFRRFDMSQEVDVKGFSVFLENYLSSSIEDILKPDQINENQKVAIDIIEMMRESYLKRG